MPVRLQGRVGAQFFFASAVLTCFFPVVPAQSLPRAIDSAPPDLAVGDMHLLSASSGWVWRGSHILRTSTAGQIWTDITPPLRANQVVGGVYFLDAEHGWVVLQTLDTIDLPTVSVAATADGGKSWSVVSVAEEARPQYSGGSLSFVDERRGWMLMDIQGNSALSSGNLFVTDDGGTTWSALPQAPVAGKIQFFPAATGWLVGGVHEDELYRTRDGGSTWARNVMVLPKRVQPYTIVGGDGKTYSMHPTYMGPYFSTEQDGILAVSVPVSERNGPLLTYTTQDRGDTWQLRKVDSDTSISTMYAPLAFFDSTYIQLGSPGGTASGILAFRSDYSATAQAISTRLPNKHSVVKKADFLDALHGWLLMSDNSLLGTVDGGKTLIVLIPSERRKSPIYSKPEKGSAQRSEGVQPQIGGTGTVNALG